jgi:putative Mg2+ transporter-C (MgtC) family protein
MSALHWALLPEEVLRLLLAILLGALVGAERETHAKAAGLRTMIAICMGAALFTIISSRMGGPNEATRVASNIVTGIGFLGAGVIIHAGGRVQGVTTAAAIWLVAALGMASGAGFYLIAIVSGAILLVVLQLFPPVENWIERLTYVRLYEIVFRGDLQATESLIEQIKADGLKLVDRKETRSADGLVLTWAVAGRGSRHAILVKTFLMDTRILALTY